MNIILIGPPGSGKGTQAQKLIKEFSLTYFSSGDICRQLAKEDSSLGRQVANLINQGQLVPDQLMKEIVKDFLARNEGSIIFDGYPRGVEQAIFLKEILADRGGINLVISLVVADEVLLTRLSSRVICRDCRAVYNLVTNPPHQESICDRCGGQLYQREDEKPATIKKRLTVFAQQTQPVIDFFTQEGIVFSIDADQPIEAIYRLIKDKLINLGLKPISA